MARPAEAQRCSKKQHEEHHCSTHAVSNAVGPTPERSKTTEQAARSQFRPLRRGRGRYLLWGHLHPSLCFGPHSMGSRGNFWGLHALPCILDLVHYSLVCLLAENNLKPSRNHHSCLSLNQDQLFGIRAGSAGAPSQSWGAVGRQIPSGPKI